MEKTPISEEMLIAAIEQADRELLEEIVDAVICTYSRRYPEYEFYFCREARLNRSGKQGKCENGKFLQILHGCGNIDFR